MIDGLLEIGIMFAILGAIASPAIIGGIITIAIRAARERRMRRLTPLCRVGADWGGYHRR